MKKALLASFLMLFAIVFSGTVSAKEQGPLGLTGFGVYGSFGTTMGGGVGLSLKWGSFPVIGLKYNFAGNQFNVSADYYVIDAEGLARNLSYFLGGGVYAGINGNDSSNPFAFGLRIPVGLQFWPVKKLELFLSPILSIPLLPTPSVDFGVEFGARIRF
ncbi:MAG: hypothetical protein WCT14_13275 [Treponemataceae bacterium]